MVDDDEPATPEELAAAAALARALDGGASAETAFDSGSQGGVDAQDLAAVGRLRAVAGREAPLGELRARALARAAVGEALGRRARSRRRHLVAASLAVAVAALLALRIIVLRPEPPSVLPDRLASRSAGLLVPGPFPSSQTEAQRLDAITADRLVAYRELRVRAVAGRAR